jgi:hypothetical protein
VQVLNLYAVLLGGRTKGCHIELHDVVFVIGASLEELYPQLVNKWFGDTSKGLHIDSSIELKYIDGHEVIIGLDNPVISENHLSKKLYFANFGGYKPNYFGELHEMNFYVAHSRIDALARAKGDLCVGSHQQHSDDHHVVDDLIALDSIGPFYIQLIPTNNPCDLQIHSYYRKLSLPDILERAALLKTTAEETVS